MGSPLYAALCESAAQTYETDSAFRALLDANAGRSRLALRLLGAAHFRALRGSAPQIAQHFPSTGGDGDAAAAWGAIERDVAANRLAYERLLARPVQTNEVARAMPVLAAMLTVADQTRMPLRVYEIGSSAGLLLHFDRYRYTGDRWAWGDPDSLLHLRNSSRGGAPANLDARLEVAARRGCDVHPLDVTKTDDAETLLGFVWADQPDRLERLRSAIAVARQDPVTVDRADGPEWIRHIAQPQPGYACVAFHTVILEHLTPEQRDALQARIGELGARATRVAPFAWVRMESAGRYETNVTVWPGGDESLVALSDGHAQDIEWGMSLE